jgi:hypothetical protein
MPCHFVGILGGVSMLALFYLPFYFVKLEMILDVNLMDYNRLVVLGGLLEKERTKIPTS